MSEVPLYRGVVRVEVESKLVVGRALRRRRARLLSRFGVDCCLFFLLFTLVTGPRRSLRLKLSDTRVYEPQIRARLGTSRVTIY